VRRKFIKFDLQEFIQNNRDIFRHLTLIDVELYIDEKECKKIVAFLKLNRKRFRFILYYILQGKYNESLYGKENVSDKAKHITAMKFSGKLNSRIYCKEFFLLTGKKIIAIELLEHKNFQSANRKSLKPKLESIGGYTYEFE
jgi:hypothetical protein